MALNSLGLGFTFRANDETGPGMASAQGNLAKTTKAAEAASLSMKDIGKGFEKIAAGAALAGAALTAALGASVFEAAKFQYGVASIATEADAAKLPASEIAKLAKQMATTYGGDLDTQIKAIYQGVAAGADTAAKSLDLMNAANRLAIAGQTTQETALLGITKVLNNYNLGFDHATDVADAFFVAVRGGQTTVGELGNAIGEIAALGKNAGVSMEELIASLGTAATMGKDTASSAASMKAALSGIAHPTSEAAAEAQRLGISFNSVELRSKGLVGFLKEISTSSKYNADSMSKLFGSTEAAGFMSALVSNNMSALNSMMKDMGDRAGGSEKAFQTMSATLQQTASILKANLQVAMVDIGSAFLPLITMTTKFITAIVKGFNDLPDPAKKAIAIFLAVSAAVLVVAGVVAGLVGALLTAELPLAAMGVALFAVVYAAIPLIAAGGLLAATVYSIGRAFDDNIGGLKMTVVPLFEKIKLLWDALGQAFSQGGFSGSVRDELNKGNEPIKNFVVNVYSFAMRIKNFIDGVTKGFESASNAAGPTFAKLSIALERLSGALGKLFGGKQDPNKAAEAFDKFGTSGQKVGMVIEKITEAIVAGFTFAIDFVSAFLETAQRLSGSFESVWNAVKILWSTLGELGDALGELSVAFGGSASSADDSGGKLALFVGVLAEVLTTAIQIVAFLIGMFVPTIRVLAATFGVVGEVFKAVFGAMKAEILAIVGLIAKVADGLASLAGKDLGLSKGLQGMTNPSTKGNSGGWLAPSPTATGKGTPTDASGGNSAFIGASAPGPTVAAPITTVPQAGGTPGTSPALATMQTSMTPGAGAPGGAMTADQMEASMTRAMRAAPPPQASPVVVPVYIDGQKVAEAAANATNSNATRGFSPTPLPAG